MKLRNFSQEKPEAFRDLLCFPSAFDSHVYARWESDEYRDFTDCCSGDCKSKDEFESHYLYWIYEDELLAYLKELKDGK